MFRRLSWSPALLVLPAVLVIMLGLYAADAGVKDLLGIKRPPVFNVSSPAPGELDLNVLGQSHYIASRLPVVEFRAQPGRMTVGSGRSALIINLRPRIPGSEKIISSIKDAVTQATEACFYASRVIYDWWTNL